MRIWGSGSLGSHANAAVGDLASKVDGRTEEVALRAARAIAVAVRLARIPSLLVLLVPLPFVFTTLVLGVVAHGPVGIVILLVGAAMLVVSGAFWGRRRRILQAVEEPDVLATELAIVIGLSGKVDETRGALTQIAGGGGWRLLGRLKGVWSGTKMTGRWIESVGDLPRARYFAPPKIGTSVALTTAALWLVPISVVVALFALVGAVAGSW